VGKARFLRAGAAGAAVIGVVGLGPQAGAQTQLPEIVVTTPSPVAKSAKKPATKAAPKADPAEPEAPPKGTARIAKDAFASVTVVTADEIVAAPSATVAGALMSQPGLIASTFAPGASRPVIRGYDNFRVLMQESGIGAHDVSALSEDHAVPIDPLAVDRIEVVRGPATLRYGSQAIGGVVNAITGRIPEIIPPKGVSFFTQGGLTSVDGGWDGAFKVMAGSGNAVVYADAFKRRSGDYDTPFGKQFNTFVASEGFALGASLVGKDGYIGIAFSRFTSLYGIPGEEALEHRPFIDLLQDKLQARGEWRVRSAGVEAVRFWLGTSWYVHDELHLHEPDDPAQVGSKFKNRQTEGRGEVEHQAVLTALGELRGAVGVHFARKRTTALSFEGDGLLDPARTASLAAFWFEELQLTRKLRLQAALRLEQTTVEGVGLDGATPKAFARTFMPLSASLGVLYELPGSVVLRLTGQHSERAPADAELLSKGMHEATGTFEIGSPLLTKEQAETFEVGLRKATGAFRFDAAAFFTKFDGFIYKGLTGVECNATLASCGAADPNEELLDQVLYQQRKAIFYGVELLGELDIGRIWGGVWGIDGRYDFVHAMFDDAEGGNVPRLPPHRAGLGLYYRDLNWLARLGFLHAFDQDRVGASETSTKGYTLLNAGLAYTFKLDPGAGLNGLVPEMTIGLKGENLLDDDVRNHVSFKAHEVVLPGRTIRVYGAVKLN
jgi:iron complex outermembrane receptor protein